jgi:hypothetical protein
VTIAIIAGTFALCVLMVFSGRSVVFGSQTFRFMDEGGVTTALAQRAVEAKAVDTITPEQLRQISAVLVQRASEGDPRAALFAFEVARLQREREKEAAKAGQTPR